MPSTHQTSSLAGVVRSFPFRCKAQQTKKGRWGNGLAGQTKCSTLEDKIVTYTTFIRKRNSFVGNSQDNHSATYRRFMLNYCKHYSYFLYFCVGAFRSSKFIAYLINSSSNLSDGSGNNSPSSLSNRMSYKLTIIGSLIWIPSNTRTTQQVKWH